VSAGVCAAVQEQTIPGQQGRGGKCRVNKIAVFIWVSWWHALVYELVSLTCIITVFMQRTLRAVSIHL
jgi:hypothetical protein